MQGNTTSFPVSYDAPVTVTAGNAHTGSASCPACSPEVAPVIPLPRTGRRLVIVPAPTADVSAAEARGSDRYPVLVEPGQLRRGMRVGRWTLTGAHAVDYFRDCTGAPCWQRVPPDASGARWRCRCDCGTERHVWVSGLIVAGTLSCGCFRADRNRFRAAQRAAERRSGVAA